MGCPVENGWRYTKIRECFGRLGSFNTSMICVQERGTVPRCSGCMGWNVPTLDRWKMVTLTRGKLICKYHAASGLVVGWLLMQIIQRSPVEVGSLSQYLHGLYTSQVQDVFQIYVPWRISYYYLGNGFQDQMADFTHNYFLPYLHPEIAGVPYDQGLWKPWVSLKALCKPYLSRFFWGGVP